MKRIGSPIAGLLLALAALQVAGPASAQTAGPVTITLLPEVTVDDCVVTLEQVAKLTGGPAYLRKRLARLDVADFKIGTALTTISADQVHFRVLLAGLDDGQVELRGAKRALVVENQEPCTLRKILASAAEALRAEYPGDTRNITIVPHRGIDVPTIAARAGESVGYRARAKAPLARSGRACIDVTLSVRGQVREVVPVYFEMVPLELSVRGTTREQAAVRPVSYVAPAPTSAPSGRDYLIKSGDNVKLIAQIGSARIEATGEAQQNGRPGDVIRVRNVESNRIVHGRIDRSGTIIVEY